MMSGTLQKRLKFESDVLGRHPIRISGAGTPKALSLPCVPTPQTRTEPTCVPYITVRTLHRVSEIVWVRLQVHLSVLNQYAPASAAGDWGGPLSFTRSLTMASAAACHTHASVYAVTSVRSWHVRAFVARSPHASTRHAHASLHAGHAGINRRAKRARVFAASPCLSSKTGRSAGTQSISGCLSSEALGQRRDSAAAAGGALRSIALRREPNTAWVRDTGRPAP